MVGCAVDHQTVTDVVKVLEVEQQIFAHGDPLKKMEIIHLNYASTVTLVVQITDIIAHLQFAQQIRHLLRRKIAIFTDAADTIVDQVADD